MSKDAVTVAGLIGSFAVFLIWKDRIVQELASFTTYCLSLCAGGISAWEGERLLLQCIILVLKTTGPLLLIAVVIAVAGTFAQTRFLFASDIIKPKLERINPIAGLKRLFSLRSVIEALKGIFEITILMVFIWQTLKSLFQESARYLYADLSAACAHLFSTAVSMVIRVIIAFVALSAFDYFYQWWDFERQMKMSKEEIKEEYKQTEGDPQVKSKIKERQRQMAQRRMMQQVPKADVVIRNPTHFAVALRYHPEEDNAPVVLAKGQDELALRIVRVAEENNVAVMENVPLARALYAKTELNQEIPPELYGAVAEVLVYIFHLNEERKIVK
jgi:flagellar biosynthetic protein FlhB